MKLTRDYVGRILDFLKTERNIQVDVDEHFNDVLDFSFQYRNLKVRIVYDTNGKFEVDYCTVNDTYERYETCNTQEEVVDSLMTTFYLDMDGYWE